jgi:hypothetical protein
MVMSTLKVIWNDATQMLGFEGKSGEFNRFLRSLPPNVKIYVEATKKWYVSITLSKMVMLRASDCFSQIDLNSLPETIRSQVLENMKKSSSSLASSSSGLAQAYELLYLREGAPMSVAKVVYHFLASQTHPDKGGDPEEFLKINDAWQRIEKANVNRTDS